MAAAKQKAGQAADKLNAKTGFLTTALTTVLAPILKVVAGLTALKSIILGAGIAAALVALGIAFKENFGGMREHVIGFVEWIKGALTDLKNTAIAIWESFISGFKEGGGSIEDLEVIFGGVLDGITKGLQAFWDAFGPIIKDTGKLLVDLAKIAGKWIGKIIDWLAKMEKESGMITKIIGWVTALIATFAAAWAIVQVAAAIVSVFISLISAAGAVYSALASVIAFLSTAATGFAMIISAVGTFISILVSVITTIISVGATIASVVAGIIATLNPITLVILAIIAVIIALYAAWETNFLGIRDIINKAVDTMRSKFQSFVDWLSGIPAKIKGFFSGLGESLANGVKTAFNGILPDEVGLPTVEVAGQSFGGGSIDLPELDTGGYIEETGIAKVHKGESVVPADVTKEVTNNTSNESGDSVTVNVGGIEVGDQSLDLSNMSRSDLKQLADLLADKLGDEVRNTTI